MYVRVCVCCGQLRNKKKQKFDSTRMYIGVGVTEEEGEIRSG